MRPARRLQVVTVSMDAGPLQPVAPGHDEIRQLGILLGVLVGLGQPSARMLRGADASSVSFCLPPPGGSDLADAIAAALDVLPWRHRVRVSLVDGAATAAAAQPQRAQKRRR